MAADTPSSETKPFEGKVALITGAGSGIGRAVTLRLLDDGASVFGVDIDAGALDEVAATAGERFTGHVADLSDPAACREAVEACVALHGRLDVLGNIAGIAASHHLADVTPEAYRRMMAVNADAPFFLSQAAVPHLLATHGNIVTLASNAGLMGQAYTVPYCMSKGAAVQLTRALAMEFVKTDLRVNAIAPAGVDTPLVHSFVIPDGVDLDLMQPYMGHRGMSQAEELADLFAFLASDRARSIHGAVLSVDNGITAG
ncbi:MAG: SDR family NAD(P)-dependent oxidoreductase [Microthrixaceae bacterium]